MANKIYLFILKSGKTVLFLRNADAIRKLCSNKSLRLREGLFASRNPALKFSRVAQILDRIEHHCLNFFLSNGLVKDRETNPLHTPVAISPLPIGVIVNMKRHSSDILGARIKHEYVIRITLISSENKI